MKKNARAAVDVQVLVALELAKRGHTEALTPELIGRMSEEQLLELQAVEDETSGKGSGERPSTKLRHRAVMSIPSAVIQVCRTKDLTAAEIVESVLRVRPGTNPPSVYPEIKRQTEAGNLVRIGKREPYLYRTHRDA